MKTLQDDFPKLYDEFHDMWNRKIVDLPVSKDIFRLAKNFHIYLQKKDVFEEEFFTKEEYYKDNKISNIVVDFLNSLYNIIESKKRLTKLFEDNNDEWEKAYQNILGIESKKSFYDEHENLEEVDEFYYNEDDVKKLDKNIKMVEEEDEEDENIEKKEEEIEEKKKEEEMKEKKKEENIEEMKEKKRRRKSYLEIDLHHEKQNTLKQLKINQEVFDKKVSAFDQKSIEAFLIENFEENSKVLKVLKLCHQSIVICFLGHFTEILWENLKIRYKDCQDVPWQIHFKFFSKQENRNIKTCSITHIRTEQCCQLDNDGILVKIFRFSWELEIQFDSMRMNRIEKITAKITGTDWNYNDEKLKPQKQQFIEKKFLALFGNPKIINDGLENGLKTKSSKGDESPVGDHEKLTFFSKFAKFFQNSQNKN
jgi:hypothetical protein